MRINLAASGVKFVLFRRQVTTSLSHTPSLSLSPFTFARVLDAFLLQIAPLLRPLKALLSRSSPVLASMEMMKVAFSTHLPYGHVNLSSFENQASV